MDTTSAASQSPIQHKGATLSARKAARKEQRKAEQEAERAAAEAAAAAAAEAAAAVQRAEEAQEHALIAQETEAFNAAEAARAAALAQAAAGDAAGAAAAFEEALGAYGAAAALGVQLSGDCAEYISGCRYGEGECLRHLKREAEATAKYGEGIAADPADDTLRFARGMLLMAARQYSAACVDLQAAADADAEDEDYTTQLAAARQKVTAQSDVLGKYRPGDLRRAVAAQDECKVRLLMEVGGIRPSQPSELGPTSQELQGSDGAAKMVARGLSHCTTALHEAAAADHEEMVQLLLSEGANVEALDPSGYTPLMVAAHEGQIKAVRLLLQHGASKERPPQTVASSPNARGESKDVEKERATQGALQLSEDLVAHVRRALEEATAARDAEGSTPSPGDARDEIARADRRRRTQATLSELVKAWFPGEEQRLRRSEAVVRKFEAEERRRTEVCEALRQTAN